MTMTCSHIPGPASTFEELEVASSGGAGGVREFKSEFETATYQVNGASTKRRPDSVSFDHKTAWASGPVAIADVTSGIEAYSWYVRCDTTKVYIARRNAGNNGWDAESVLFTYIGAVIDELSLAFTADGRPVVAMERATGILGPEVWLYWYRPSLPGYELITISAGRTPIVRSDIVQISPRPCGYPINVQLLYWHPTAGPQRRQESGNFSADLDQPFSFGAEDRLEEFFPTVSGKLSVVYSTRNVTTGRYELKRQDSKEYKPLKRPIFLGTGANDIAAAQGSQFFNPSGSIVTDGFPSTIRTQTLNKVDGIQVRCATTDFTEATGWNQQVYDSITDFPAGLNPFDFVDPPITLTHGMGTMSPRAFRARTYKTVNGRVYYSPWEYVFMGKGAGNLTVTDLGLSVDGLTHSFVVSSTDAALIAVVYWNGVGYVNTVVASGTTITVTRKMDINGILRTPYRFGARNVEHFAFTDSCGDAYSFDQYSKIFVDASGEAPEFPPDFIPSGANQFPGAFPAVPLIYTDPVGFPGWDAPGVSANEDPPLRPLPLAYHAYYFDPVMFMGTEIVVGSIKLTVVGATEILRVSGSTIEAHFRQDNVFGVALLDRLGVPVALQVEGCPIPLPRVPDDTPNIPTLQNIEVCCGT